MNPQKIEKIKRFLSDKAMSESVKEVLLSSFLKSKGDRDVQLLAASMIAVEKLEEGFKELIRISRSDEDKPKETGQVGL